MRLEKKNILLISPEPWDHIFVSKHHYATHLAYRGNRVFFLNPPSGRYAVETTEYENVFSLHYGGFIKGLRFFPSFLQRYFIRKKFEQLQKLCQVQFDIVWSFDNSVFFDFSALPKEVYAISHIVDLNQNFEFEKATRTADLCLGVIYKIVQKQRRFNPNAHLMGHGVQEFKEQINPVQFPGENKIKCLYIGNLGMPYIDWPLLRQCVETFKEADFIFLGAGHLPIQADNCFHLERVPAKELSDYLNAADIMLLAYTDSYYEQYATPHKMMEYLGSGKMILATWTQEYKELEKEELIKMCNDGDQFFNEFKQLTSNLEFWNHKDKVSARKAFALQNTYDKQLNKIEKLLDK